MELVHKLFGEGHDLNTLQMSLRAVVVFCIALLLIRISGRRSFGMHTPLDNIVALLLGALLSRAIAGSSPFIPVITASTLLVVAHRMVAYLVVHNATAARWIQGNKIPLFQNGKANRHNMDRALVHDEDIQQGLRSKAQTEKYDTIDKVFMERNGEITVTKKAD